MPVAFPSPGAPASLACATSRLAACLLLAACGSSPVPNAATAGAAGGPAAGTATSPESTDTAALAGASIDETCAALRSAIVDAEERALRDRAEAEAEEYGEDPEEILREWARERSEDAPPEPPRWRCPAQDPGYYLPQADIPALRLGDVTARALAAERIDYESSTERFLYLVVREGTGAARFEPVARASDLGHGQDWEQLRVVGLAAEDDAIVMDAERLECVPAGFDEETVGEPPACHVIVRLRVRCARSAGEWACEHADEPVEEEIWAE